MLQDTLRALRAREGITQARAAELARVPVQTYAGWESGRSVPLAPRLARLADVYGVSIDTLTGRAPADAPGDDDELSALIALLSPAQKKSLASFIRSMSPGGGAGYKQVRTSSIGIVLYYMVGYASASHIWTHSDTHSGTHIAPVCITLSTPAPARGAA